MKNNENQLTVFEHQTIKLNQKIENFILDEKRLKALQRYYGEVGVPYFSLIHNGVRFNEYVGVLQIGNITIEVLPKADNAFTGTNEKKKWRDVLIDMLLAVGAFDIQAPSSSALKLKPNTILDLYFELFVKEVEYLLHSGLVKKYHKHEGNTTALKGSLQFGKHIQQNLTHQERFYVRSTIYDAEHTMHRILYKTICLLKKINTIPSILSNIGCLLLNFPEMPNIKVSEITFNKLVYNRKTQCYKKAINIAKLLLLKYHPDVRAGNDTVLALMFDMNKLWEQFVYVSLRKHTSNNTTISAQCYKYFWKPEDGNRSKIIPDIVINKNMNTCVVLDTKWKNLNGCNPSPDDLRQMYVYHQYYQAKRVALVYPGQKLIKSKGNYLHHITSKEEEEKECSVVCLPIVSQIKLWQKKIYTDLQPLIDL